MPDISLPPAPPTLDHPGIAARIPHQGRMALLDAMTAWTEDAIDCRATSHRAPDHPLRTASGLLAPCAIEYAAQAMALHGALVAAASGAAPSPRPGFLASVRSVRMAVARLDDIPGALKVHAARLAGDARQILYRFEVADEDGTPLVDGRATVVLDTPLAGDDGVPA